MLLWLPCKLGNNKLTEGYEKIKELASCLLFQCSCFIYFLEENTSRSNHISFDINIRTAYSSMRACRQGYSRFLSLMNLPKPITSTKKNSIYELRQNYSRSIIVQRLG